MAAARTALGLTIATLATTAALVAPAPATANGDPASHVLLARSVFIPVDAPVSKDVVKQLETVVERARIAGYQIRVAIIGAPVDLGTVSSLYGKPQDYAKHLGRGIRFIYSGRLLIVMPNGFGYFDARGRSGPERDVLGDLAVQEGPDELVQSATRAVARLATAAGHPVAVPPLETNGNRLVLVVGGALTAALLASGLGLALWLRRKPSLPDS